MKVIHLILPSQSHIKMQCVIHGHNNRVIHMTITLHANYRYYYSNPRPNSKHGMTTKTTITNTMPNQTPPSAGWGSLGGEEKKKKGVSTLLFFIGQNFIKFEACVTLIYRIILSDQGFKRHPDQFEELAEHKAILKNTM